MAKSIFEQLGGTYEQQGDYLLPCLTVPDEKEQPIGVWGQRHLRHHIVGMLKPVTRHRHMEGTQPLNGHRLSLHQRYVQVVLLNQIPQYPVE